ncbi:hypothetical protein B0O80DRAFT_4453 [Mortierella sp. GBAus27b]|nr:hypothetical protein B0O80DRAFT_4453 [Mortierella sp. GBAus27b]
MPSTRNTDTIGRRPFKCEHPNCGKTFWRAFNLRAHSKTHDPLRRDFACDTCQCSFHRECDLARHRRQQFPRQNPCHPTLNPILNYFFLYHNGKGISFHDTTRSRKPNPGAGDARMFKALEATNRSRVQDVRNNHIIEAKDTADPSMTKENEIPVFISFRRCFLFLYCIHAELFKHCGEANYQKCGADREDNTVGFLDY